MSLKSNSVVLTVPNCSQAIIFNFPRIFSVKTLVQTYLMTSEKYRIDPGTSLVVLPHV